MKMLYNTEYNVTQYKNTIIGLIGSAAHRKKERN